MVKVSCGFVSNSSSVTYFMMWVGVDEPPKDPCTRWVGVSTLAEELRGFPGADALHFPGESECKRHYDTTWFPCSDDGEHFLCHTCMSNWDEWIAKIKPWVQSKRMKEPSASFGDRSSTMETGATTTTALAYDLPPREPGERTHELSREILVRIFRFNITREWSATFRLDREVLKATKDLISASAVCKLWREVALDEELWFEVVKISAVQKFLPGWWEDTEQQARFSHLEHITSCRELALRISKMHVAFSLRVEAGDLTPGFDDVIRKWDFDDTTHENLAEVLRGHTTGAIVVGQGYDSDVEHWKAMYSDAILIGKHKRR